MNPALSLFLDNIQCGVMIISALTCGAGFIAGVLLGGVLAGSRNVEEVEEAYWQGWEKGDRLGKEVGKGSHEGTKARRGNGTKGTDGTNADGEVQS